MESTSVGYIQSTAKRLLLKPVLSNTLLKHKIWLNGNCFGHKNSMAKGGNRWGNVESIMTDIFSKKRGFYSCLQWVIFRVNRPFKEGEFCFFVMLLTRSEFVSFKSSGWHLMGNKACILLWNTRVHILLERWLIIEVAVTCRWNFRPNLIV